jgi:tyrosyl-tRNA synthetase
MTEILEGLDGVQKMSKSLGNAIGVNDPASEMYGKLMSINDDLMWKYYSFLTDLKQSEIDAMRDTVARGELHPMQAKKNLAHSITADFHSPTEADHAAESWATQFQQKGVADNLEEVEVPFSEIESPVLSSTNLIRLATLLVRLGLASSNGEATRKMNEGAVSVEGLKQRGPGYGIDNELLTSKPPIKISVRLGKRAKVAAITMTDEEYARCLKRAQR